MAITWRSDAEIDRILELRERERLSWRALAEIVEEPVWRLRYWSRRRTTPPNAERPSFVELVPTLASDESPTANAHEVAISSRNRLRSDAFDIDLPSGVRVHVAPDFDVDALRRLISVLSSC